MRAVDQRATDVTSPFDTVALFGIDFVDVDDESVVADHLVAWQPNPAGTTPLDDTLPIVFTPNVDIVVQLAEPEQVDLADVILRSRYILPDGAPIVWVSKAGGTPLGTRVAGSSVFDEWWPRIAAAGRRVTVVCSTPKVEAGLLAEHPDARTLVPPMIPFTEEAIGELADQIVATAAAGPPSEFCVLAIGHPKDAALALAVVERWPSDVPTPLCLCLGASAEMYLGLRKRAPRWAQRIGLEWFGRLVQEPRRMAHRYFVRDAAFFPMAWREIRSLRS